MWRVLFYICVYSSQPSSSSSSSSSRLWEALKPGWGRKRHKVISCILSVKAAEILMKIKEAIQFTRFHICILVQIYLQMSLFFFFPSSSIFINQYIMFFGTNYRKLIANCFDQLMFLNYFQAKTPFNSVEWHVWIHFFGKLKQPFITVFWHFINQSIINQLQPLYQTNASIGQNIKNYTIIASYWMLSLVYAV